MGANWPPNTTDASRRRFCTRRGTDARKKRRPRADFERRSPHRRKNADEWGCQSRSCSGKEKNRALRVQFGARVASGTVERSIADDRWRRWAAAHRHRSLCADPYLMSVVRPARRLIRAVRNWTVPSRGSGGLSMVRSSQLKAFVTSLAALVAVLTLVCGSAKRRSSRSRSPGRASARSACRCRERPRASLGRRRGHPPGPVLRRRDAPDRYGGLRSEHGAHRRGVRQRVALRVHGGGRGQAGLLVRADGPRGQRREPSS